MGAGASGPSQSTICEQSPAPSGYAFMFNCQTPSIASGSSWTFTLTYTGTQGVAFTNQLFVGEAGPGDPNLANNTSTLNSWFGPAADLALTQVSGRAPATGQAQIINRIKNNGPSPANSLQFVAEIASPGFSSVGATSNLSGSSCQFIPPASGYNVAVACTIASLAPGATWTETFTYHGAAGGALKQSGKVTANSPSDPAPSNNAASTTTNYGT
jgi:hypothetical protein